MNWLIYSLDTVADECDGWISNAAKVCRTTIQKYNVANFSTNIIPFTATLLNPALKMTYFKEHNYSQSKIKEIEKGVHEIFKSDYEMKGSVSTEKSEDEDDELFSHMFKRAKTEKLSKEFQKFLRYPISSPKCDVMDYWKTNETEFPCLSKMAADYLAASSSIRCEEEIENDESATPEKIRIRHCLEHWSK